MTDVRNGFDTLANKLELEAQVRALEEQLLEQQRQAGLYYSNAEAMKKERDDALASVERLSIENSNLHADWKDAEARAKYYDNENTKQNIKLHATLFTLFSISIRWPFLFLPKALKEEVRKLVA